MPAAGISVAAAWMESPMAESLPDIIARDLDVLFCGINPGLEAARTGHHFAGQGNRFWRVIHLAGFTPQQLHPENDQAILRYGCGLTAVVARPTARAVQLAPEEFIAAAADFEQKVGRFTPRFVAFLGKASYAGLSGQRDIAWGPQEKTLAGAAVWVLPNPSGRNRAFNLDRLVRCYRELQLTAIE